MLSSDQGHRTNHSHAHPIAVEMTRAAVQELDLPDVGAGGESA